MTEINTRNDDITELQTLAFNRLQMRKEWLAMFEPAKVTCDADSRH